MGKSIPFQVHEENVGVLRNEFAFLVVDLCDCRIESLLVDEFRRFLAQGDAFLFYPLCAITLAARATPAITTNAITATFLIASPFPSPLPPASHFLRSLLALYPAVPSDHLLSIDGQTKGFFRRRAQLANRFPVRWEKKIESRIAPPLMPGWCCDCLEEKISMLNDESILSIGACQIRAGIAGHTTRVFPREPQMSHICLFHEKRELGGKPKSLLLLRWCRRRDLNPHGFPHHPLKMACLPVPPLRHAARKNILSTLPRKSIRRVDALNVFLPKSPASL